MELRYIDEQSKLLKGEAHLIAFLCNFKLGNLLNAIVQAASISHLK